MHHANLQTKIIPQIHWNYTVYQIKQVKIICISMTDLNKYQCKANSLLINGHAMLGPHHASDMWTPLAAHQRARQVRSSMPGSPVAVRACACLLGRWLLPRVRQHLAISTVSRCCNLHRSTNIQQLRRQNLCSRWTLFVELSSNPAVQSPPTVCLDDRWRNTFLAMQEHGALWPRYVVS